jgi:hypothetical protein
LFILRASPIITLFLILYGLVKLRHFGVTFLFGRVVNENISVESLRAVRVYRLEVLVVHYVTQGIFHNGAHRIYVPQIWLEKLGVILRKRIVQLYLRVLHVRALPLVGTRVHTTILLHLGCWLVV